MPTPELALVLTATSRNLAGIRERVRNYASACGLPVMAVDDVVLAVDEAVTNVLRHAYAPGKPARLEIIGTVAGDRIVIRVRDFGRKFSPRPVTEAQIQKALTRHQSHGLGRFLMKKCMDSVRYRSVPRRYNETVMIKHISPC